MASGTIKAVASKADISALNDQVASKTPIKTKNYSSASASALIDELIVDAYTYIASNSLTSLVCGGTLRGQTQYSAIFTKYQGGAFASGIVNVGSDIYNATYNANTSTITKYKAASNDQFTQITTRKDYKFGGFGTVVVNRIGNMCYLSALVGTYSNSAADGVLTVTSGSTTVTMTLPSGYKPIVNCEVREVNANKRITIQAGGDICCNEQITNTALRFSACWMTNDAFPT